MPQLRACLHGEGQWHDCSYVEARNRLIPEAERIAFRRTSALGQPPNGMGFNREFFAAMDELAQTPRRAVAV